MLMKEIAIFQTRTEEKASTVEKEQYQGIMGSIIFLMVETRLDIVFTISVASCFVINLGHQQINVMKIILQYLKGLRDQDITYSDQKKLFINEYLDSS